MECGRGSYEQAFAPVILERVELVVGNPPWINWKHLPEAWQERSESLWKTWDLWATKTRASGIPLSDIASLLLARSIATYAKPGAIVGFLVPESLLIGDPGNERIRRCHLRSDSSPDLNVHIVLSLLTTGPRLSPLALMHKTSQSASTSALTTKLSGRSPRRRGIEHSPVKGSSQNLIGTRCQGR